MWSVTRMSCGVNAIKFQLRRDTSSNWTSQNPILRVGEPGFDTTSYGLKIGDGVSRWNVLPYISQGDIGPQGPPGIPGTGLINVYGSYYDTTTQRVTGADVPTPILLNSVSFEQGIARGTPTSRIVVSQSGLYKLFGSPQFAKDKSSSDRCFLWIRKNGVDVPDSASLVVVQGNNGQTFPAIEYFISLNAGDYVEFYFSSPESSMRCETFPANGIHPSVPSMIVNILRFG